MKSWKMEQKPPKPECFCALTVGEMMENKKRYSCGVVSKCRDAARLYFGPHRSTSEQVGRSRFEEGVSIKEGCTDEGTQN